MTINRYISHSLILSILTLLFISAKEKESEPEHFATSFSTTRLIEHTGVYSLEGIAVTMPIFSMYQHSQDIQDTLQGKVIYRLYFDSTSMAAGQELQRTKDSLILLVDNKQELSFKDSCVIDSLLRLFLAPKIIWLEKKERYTCPFHMAMVHYVIAPTPTDK